MSIEDQNKEINNKKVKMFVSITHIVNCLKLYHCFTVKIENKNKTLNY